MLEPTLEKPWVLHKYANEAQRRRCGRWGQLGCSLHACRLLRATSGAGPVSPYVAAGRSVHASRGSGAMVSKRIRILTSYTRRFNRKPAGCRGQSEIGGCDRSGLARPPQGARGGVTKARRRAGRAPAGIPTLVLLRQEPLSLNRAMWASHSVPCRHSAIRASSCQPTVAQAKHVALVTLVALPLGHGLLPAGIMGECQMSLASSGPRNASTVER